MPTRPRCLVRARARSGSPQPRSPRASSWALARRPPPFVERPPPHALCSTSTLGKASPPLFVTRPQPAKDATPTSVLDIASDLITPAAGWCPGTRATISDAELESELLDRVLEREFEANEQSDRALFAGFPRPMPGASKRGVPPNAPFMPAIKWPHVFVLGRFQFVSLKLP